MSKECIQRFVIQNNGSYARRNSQKQSVYISFIDNRLYETEIKLEIGIAMASAIGMVDFGKV